MQGSVNNPPAGRGRRKSWHDVQGGQDSVDTVSSEYLRTVSLRVKRRKDEPARRNAAPERVFHIHDTILRAYAPMLLGRLDALRPQGPPPEEILASKALALAARSRIVGVSLTSEEAEEKALLASDCILLPVEMVDDEDLTAELVLEGCPETFAVAVDWMYGTDLQLTYAQMTKWADKGCELLTVAQELGIDALEYAIRRAIYEAPLRGGPQLAWAMLPVCERHGLRREMEQACRVIARCGGFGSSSARLKTLSMRGLTALMSSKAWVVEHEDEILSLAEVWMQAMLPEGPEVTKAQRQSSLDALGLVDESAQWDVKWGTLQKQRLDILVQKRIVPYPLLLDICKWADLAHGSDELQQQIQEAQRETLEASKHKREKGITLHSCEAEMDKAQHELDRLEERAHVESHTDPLLAEALSTARKKLSSLRMQVVVARDHLIRADESLGMIVESTQNFRAHKGNVHLTDATVDWRRSSNTLAGASGNHVQRILAGVTKRQRPEKRPQRKRKEKAEDATTEGQELTAEDFEERYVTGFCPWLRRRRCHHVMFQTPSNWKSHFESIRMERDRVVLQPRSPVSAASFRTNQERVAAKQKSKEAHAQFVGERLFFEGRHEMLIRIVRQRSTDGEVPELKGVHFGIAVFDTNDSADESPLQSDEEEVKKQIIGERGRRTSANLVDLERAPPSPDGGLEKMEKIRRRSIGSVADVTRKLKTKKSMANPRPNQSWRERERRMFAKKAPSSVVQPDEDTFHDVLKEQSLDHVKAGTVIDTVLLLVVEWNRLRWAVEQVVCESPESSDFLVQHKFLDRWSDEQKLEEDLKLGNQHRPADDEDTMYAFFLDIHSAELHGSTDEGGSVFVEVLPQEALRRSWWVDLMDRSADGQPHCGNEGPADWGRPLKLSSLPDADCDRNR